MRAVDRRRVGGHIIEIGLDDNRRVINPEIIKSNSTAILTDRSQPVVLVIEINAASGGVNQVLDDYRSVRHRNSSLLRRGSH